MTLRPLAGRTARYAAVGAICAVANNGVIILGDLVGAHYVAMTVLSFVLVTPLGYVLHTSFTFRERRSWRGFLLFSSGVATGFPIFLLSMAILCSGLGLPVVLAAPITTAVVIFWNFGSAHWAILGRWGLH